MEKKKFFIETFGCQMNVVDSEKAAALLCQNGYEMTDDLRQADVILLNTCSVREKPEEKVYARVHQIRRERKGKVVVGVMGCVAQAQGNGVIGRAPGVDLVVGTQSLKRLPDLLSQVAAGSAPVIDTKSANVAEFLEVSPAERRLRHVAYVTIMEGCDKFCSFCIVPFTRGRERSRSPEKILAEMQSLARHGYKEVHLLGQNVNSYGQGRRIEDGRQMPFAGLLRYVARHSGIPRIKFTTSHPRDFNDEIVRAIEEFPNLCNWVHLPPQAGSNRVLFMMNRGYSREDYLRKVERLKRAKREMTITGDIIVGFPGESDSDFKETLQLIKEVEFDGLYVFKYSPRFGTPAARWGDQIPDQVKTERLMEADALQREMQMRKHQNYIGKTIEVLVEGRSHKSPLHMSGHSACNLVVNFEATDTNIYGAIVKVEISKVNPHSLFGRFISRLG